MSSARTEILAAIRSALGSQPQAPEIPRSYSVCRHGDPVERFCERAAEYRATVTRATEAGLGAAIAAALEARGSARVVTAGTWHAIGVDVTVDDGTLSPRELDEFDAALTGCALAVAETGTIVLDGAEASGRRALTLVPDHHVCVVRAAQVVATVPNAIAALADAAREGRPITFVSGPSATSDIELERVEGVHGPRCLDIVVTEPDRQATPRSPETPS